jgi:hypothetical protein
MTYSPQDTQRYLKKLMFLPQKLQIKYAVLNVSHQCLEMKFQGSALALRKA